MNQVLVNFYNLDVTVQTSVDYWLNTLAELKKSLIERDRNDTLRYKKYYGFDHQDERHFDLVVDTTSLTPEKTEEIILKFVQKVIKVRESVSPRPKR